MIRFNATLSKPYLWHEVKVYFLWDASFKKVISSLYFSSLSCWYSWLLNEYMVSFQVICLSKVKLLNAMFHLMTQLVQHFPSLLMWPIVCSAHALLRWTLRVRYNFISFVELYHVLVDIYILYNKNFNCPMLLSPCYIFNLETLIYDNDIKCVWPKFESRLNWHTYAYGIPRVYTITVFVIGFQLVILFVTCLRSLFCYFGCDFKS